MSPRLVVTFPLTGAVLGQVVALVGVTPSRLAASERVASDRGEAALGVAEEPEAEVPEPVAVFAAGEAGEVEEGEAGEVEGAAPCSVLDPQLERNKTTNKTTKGCHCLSFLGLLFIVLHVSSYYIIS